MRTVNTFFDILSHNLSSGNSDHPAVIEPDGTSWSYQQLYTRGLQVAAKLHTLGVRKGDRVALHLPPGLDEISGCFAIARLGAVFVNIHHRWLPHQTLHVINDCQIKVILTDKRRLDRLQEHPWPQTLTHAVLTTPPTDDDPRLIAWPRNNSTDQTPHGRVIDLDLCAILYTSGSTGLPKGVMLSHRNLVEVTRVAVLNQENTADDRIFGVMPLAFGFGLSQLTVMCLLGGTYVLPPVQMAHELLRVMIQNRVTGLAAVPSVWIELVAYLEETPTTLPDLRYVSIGGASTPAFILDAFPRVFPDAQMYMGYGFTEAQRSTLVPWRWFKRKKGSLGRAIPNVDVYVINPGVGVCEPGQPGELISRGSLISMGYWGNPEATAEKIKPCPELAHLIGDEKVAYSGDIVTVDEEGFYWFVGRKNNIIKTGGYRVGPAEIEAVVRKSDAVDEAVAWGAPHETLGQVIHVAITKHGESVDTEKLLNFCRRTMPAYQVPRKIHVWDGPFPHNVHGKLDRPKIVKAYTEQT